MDISTYILLIVNIFTLIILYGTLREIRNQRIGAYLPELLIKEKIITFDSEYSENGFKILNPSNIEFPKIDSVDLDFANIMSKFPIINTKSRQYSFEIYNIGLGTAKKIKVEFIYEYTELVKLIQEVDKDKKINVNIFEEGGLQIEIDENLDLFPQLEYSSDYVYIKNNEEAIFYIPYAFVDLYCLYWTLLLKNHRFSAAADYLSRVPKIHIKINYVDIYNRNLTKSYIINYRLISLFGNVKGIFQSSFNFVPEEETS